ncbi:hypothetical protein F2P81_007450 [Scophthalmus maximus]|uniref:Uncharacterized protein n=1 Tax=Scophthalmus maximus TaxID=52904 RepID=A0A6A4T294_SCOMX|nr:hypothetical protein F2P81_007450 [Scophthalmus maximus]
MEKTKSSIIIHVYNSDTENEFGCHSADRSLKLWLPLLLRLMKRGTLEHIRSCCPKALGEGRFTWRHDQVLKAIAEAIFTSITQNKPLRTSKAGDCFRPSREEAYAPAKGDSLELHRTGRLRQTWESSSDSQSTLWKPP